MAGGRAAGHRGAAALGPLAAGILFAAAVGVVRDCLRFLRAAQVGSPAGTLDHLQLCTRDNETVGTVEGVLIDPPARRVRFFVVQSPYGPNQYLLSAETPVRVEPDGGVGHVESEQAELRLEPYDPAGVRPFSEEDAITAMFSPRAA